MLELKECDAFQRAGALLYVSPVYSVYDVEYGIRYFDT